MKTKLIKAVYLTELEMLIRDWYIEEKVYDKIQRILIDKVSTGFTAMIDYKP